MGDQTMRTRRSMLGGLVGGVVALAAGALGRPAPANAANGDAIVVGGSHSGTAVTSVFSTVDGLAASSSGQAKAGLTGKASANMGVGVLGDVSYGLGRYGVRGMAGYGTLQTGQVAVSALHGGSTGSAMEAAGPNGLLASALKSGGLGVGGTANQGIGVQGMTETGTGVHAFSTGTGIALRVTGRTLLVNCAGRAWIAAGQSSVVVVPGTKVGTGTNVVASLNGSAGGLTVVHRVELNTVGNAFTIYLTAPATVNVPVSWHLFN